MDNNIYERYFKDYTTSLYDCGNRLKHRHIKAMMPRLEGKKVLDVGAGSGDIRHVLIKEHGAAPSNYLSVDISAQTLALAEKLANDTGTGPFLSKQADAQRLSQEIDGKFDVMVCSEVLEHIPDDAGTLKSMAELLAEDGCIIITVPYLGTPIEQWGHLRHYSMASFQELVSNAGLRITSIAFVGRLHNLTWVYLKVAFAAIWYGFRKITGLMRNTNYIASPLHRRVVMPFIDRFLLLDDLFTKKTTSFIGSQATIIATIKEKEK